MIIRDEKEHQGAQHTDNYQKTQQKKEGINGSVVKTDFTKFYQEVATITIIEVITELQTLQNS